MSMNSALRTNGARVSPSRGHHQLSRITGTAWAPGKSGSGTTNRSEVSCAPVGTRRSSAGRQRVAAFTSSRSQATMCWSTSGSHTLLSPFSKSVATLRVDSMSLGVGWDGVRRVDH
ncbi:unnamed protein product [Prorocentrum cordatum]|uniref:Uncharacterized protein n=1 Tax=Prorocentrum cordatum TaxID=2364126 RepID=A0ABN9YC48_9DINO|nr:unnamed protein product [Polarella glacialis]